MRKLQKKARKRTQTKTREPLAEGIVPLNARGHRDWASMSYDELVAFAKEFMKENGICGRVELKKADYGLYDALLRRKLLDRVGFEEKHRAWATMSDDELVAFAKEYLEKRGINGRSELQKADGGLREALRKRKLLDKIGFEEKRRDWVSMSDGEIVACTKKFMEENGINGRKELQKADSGLYRILWRRKLLGRVGFEEKKRKGRPWKEMSDDELVVFTRIFVKENGINWRSELQKVDHGLYEALRKRKLLDKIGFEEKLRDWVSMSDGEIVACAKKFMEENGISGRRELEKANQMLYIVLRKRKLMNKVGFEVKRRVWKGMNHEQLIVFAKMFVKEKRINGKGELAKVDYGLYNALRRRKLLDSVFEDIEQAKEREEIQQIVEGLREFSV